MRFLIISFFIAVIAFNTYGQIFSNYGVKLGAVISNQSWEYKISGNMKWDNKTTVSPRIFADINLSPVQIEGELGYTMKGFETSILATTATNPDGPATYLNINNRLNYLNLSLAGRYAYVLGAFVPYVIVGPQLNILVNKNTNNIFGSVFDNYKKLNVGATLGLGTEIKNILPVSILIEYRYETDFINNYNSDNINIKNYSHVIMLGIRI